MWYCEAANKKWTDEYIKELIHNWYAKWLEIQDAPDYGVSPTKEDELEFKGLSKELSRLLVLAAHNWQMAHIDQIQDIDEMMAEEKNLIQFDLLLHGLWDDMEWIIDHLNNDYDVEPINVADMSLAIQKMHMGGTIFDYAPYDDINELELPGRGQRNLDGMSGYLSEMSNGAVEPEVHRRLEHKQIQKFHNDESPSLIISKSKGWYKGAQADLINEEDVKKILYEWYKAEYIHSYGGAGKEKFLQISRKLSNILIRAAKNWLYVHRYLDGNEEIRRELVNPVSQSMAWIIEHLNVENPNQADISVALNICHQNGQSIFQYTPSSESQKTEYFKPRYHEFTNIDDYLGKLSNGLVEPEAQRAIQHEQIHEFHDESLPEWLRAAKTKWYKTAQIETQEELKNKINWGIKKWLNSQKAYKNDDTSWLKSKSISWERAKAERLGQREIADLLSSWEQVQYRYEPKFTLDFIKHYANHPAIAPIAQEMGVNKDENQWWNRSNIEKLLNDWYKSEYINSYGGVGKEKFLKISEQLSELLIGAAERWLYFHTEWMEKHASPSEKKDILQKWPQVEWIVNALGANKHNKANISKALNIMHLSGSILDYVPYSDNQSLGGHGRNDLEGIGDLLTSLSNESVVPEAENEIHREQIRKFHEDKSPELVIANGRSWYKRAQVLEEENWSEVLSEDKDDYQYLDDQIRLSVNNWLQSQPEYTARGMRSIDSYDLNTVAKELKDESTMELANAWRDLYNYQTDKMCKNFIKHFANHPAIAPLAQKLGLKYNSNLMTEKGIKQLLYDWYKAEYVKSYGGFSGKNFQALSRKLSNLLVTAAKRWLEAHGDENLPDVNRNMHWIIDHLDVENPNQAAISIAINICHCGGSVFEYVPIHPSLESSDVQGYFTGMKNYLHQLSNDLVVPEAEKEIRHEQIKELSPEEEHSPEWLRAAKITWYKNAFIAPNDDKIDNAQLKIINLKETINDSLSNWLQNAKSYGWCSLMDESVSNKALQMGDIETYNLFNTWRKISFYPNKATLEDFIQHFANHPALKELAKSKGLNQESKIWTPNIIKNTIEEWYKTEYKIALAKEKGLNSIQLEEKFKLLSNQLADMLKEAASRWIAYHYKNWDLEEDRKANPNTLSVLKIELLKVLPNMEWVVEHMSVDNPNKAEISHALNICHYTGNILEYVPMSKNQDKTQSVRYDLEDIKEFLDKMSNESVIPEAEKEIQHEQINQLYPPKEHSDTWLKAAKVNWYKISQEIEQSDIEPLTTDIVNSTLMNWLEDTEPYSEIHPVFKPYDINVRDMAYDAKDMETYKLLLDFQEILYIRGSKDLLIKDFVHNYADHPALKDLASQYGINKETRIWRSDTIKDTIEDWYKTEYKISLAKERGLSKTTELFKHFRIVSNLLADMLKEAATRWLEYHNGIMNYEEVKTQTDFTDFDKNYLRVYPQMEWVAEHMSIENPNQADISHALNVCHCGGNILEYVPKAKNQKTGHTGRADLYDIKDFLNKMSNESVVPDAENEIRHEQINELSPSEEHSPEWLRNSKIKWYSIRK